MAMLCMPSIQQPPVVCSSYQSDAEKGKETKKCVVMRKEVQAIDARRLDGIGGGMAAADTVDRIGQSDARCAGLGRRPLSLFVPSLRHRSGPYFWN